MIKLTVQRMVDGHPMTVTAHYDARQWHWLCEDKEFYQVLKAASKAFPEDYYPDEALALVNYVAGLYNGTVTDLRHQQPRVQAAGDVY